MENNKKMYLVVDTTKYECDTSLHYHLFATLEKAQEKLEQLKTEYKEDINFDNYNYIEDTPMSFLVYNEGWYDIDNYDVYIRELEVEDYE